ncbi:MAG: DUF4136 domain-containing protein [Polaribacter sp.]
MKNIKFLVLFFLMSCASSKVITDYDDKTDFTKYKTYDFYEDNGENLNKFDVKRITTAIDEQLQSYGLKQHYNPDFFIFFDTEVSDARNNTTLNIGLGTAGRNGGVGISGGIPVNGKKIDEKLIIKFIEAKTNALFWESSLTSTIKEKRKPAERELLLQEVIQKILNTYPPKK